MMGGDYQSYLILRYNFLVRSGKIGIEKAREEFDNEYDYMHMLSLAKKEAEKGMEGWLKEKAYNGDKK